MSAAIPLRRLLICLFSHFWLISTVAASEEVSNSVKLFDQLKNSIVQVRITESNSGTKSAIGSGFFVADKVVTNYHVVSSFVFEPSLYSIDIVLGNGDRVEAKIEKIDVIHDLAILNPAKPLSNLPLRVEKKPVAKGEKIYALGNPRDLGLALVEGTYNGQIEESLFKRIHFTGSLNPGMSGGPAVLADGSVIGVNVATEGNQISFLVPSEYILALQASEKQDNNFLTTAHSQLVRNQKEYITETTHSEIQNLTLGDFSVPGKLSKAFRCWSDVQEAGYRPYLATSQYCSTEDELFLNESLTTGSIAIQHHFLESKELNIFQFSTLLQYYLTRFDPGYYGSRDEVSAYECHSSMVNTKILPVSASVCLRKYKKFSGLYDGALVLSTLPSTTRGLVSSISMSGISSESFKSIADKFLKALAWKAD